MFEVYDIDGTRIGSMDGNNIYNISGCVAYVQQISPPRMGIYGVYERYKLVRNTGEYAGELPQILRMLENGKQAAFLFYTGNNDPTWLDTAGDFWRVVSGHSPRFFRKIGYLRSSDDDLVTVRRVTIRPEDLDKVVGAACLFMRSFYPTSALRRDPLWCDAECRYFPCPKDSYCSICDYYYRTDPITGTGLSPILRKG